MARIDFQQDFMGFLPLKPVVTSGVQIGMNRKTAADFDQELLDLYQGDDEATAKLAWQRSIDFFDKTLTS